MATSGSAATLLPVAQFKESHDLKLDLAQLGPAGATVMAPPYQAMSKGDAVTMTVKTANSRGSSVRPVVTSMTTGASSRTLGATRGSSSHGRGVRPSIARLANTASRKGSNTHHQTTSSDPRTG